jgi:hypothetical protein
VIATAAKLYALLGRTESLYAQFERCEYTFNEKTRQALLAEIKSVSTALEMLANEIDPAV